MTQRMLMAFPGFNPVSGNFALQRGDTYQNKTTGTNFNPVARNLPLRGVGGIRCAVRVSVSIPLLGILRCNQAGYEFILELFEFQSRWRESRVATGAWR
jgi:hypothetical protein